MRLAVDRETLASVCISLGGRCASVILKALRAAMSAVLFLGWTGLGGLLIARLMAAGWKPVMSPSSLLDIWYSLYLSSRSWGIEVRIFCVMVVGV